MDAGEEVLNLKVFVVRVRELFQIEVEPAGLLLRGVEVDCNENFVAASGFAVAENIRIVGRMEVKGAVAVERGVVAAYLVDLSDERSEAVGCGLVPVAD